MVLPCFSPHCTHCLQLLDVAFIKALSAYYDSAVTTWLQAHPGHTVAPFQIGELFDIAFIRTAAMTATINGFRKTSIWPSDPTAFTDNDFLPAETTNILANYQDMTAPSSGSSCAQTQAQCSTPMSQITNEGNCSDNKNILNTPINLYDGQSIPKKVKNPTRTTAFSKASLPEILLIPHVGKPSIRKTRCRKRAAILNFILIQTRPCSVNVEQDIKNKALLKVDKKSKVSLQRSSASSNDDTACLYFSELHFVSLKVR